MVICEAYLQVMHPVLTRLYFLPTIAGMRINVVVNASGS